MFFIVIHKKVCTNPLVSIIIPNYNYKCFLDERIQSVLDQTYQNFEVIILDDCSTDNSREVIERYRNSPHVSNIIYNKSNSGSPFLQWQKGIDVSKGKYVWIAESDDYCDSHMLEELMDLCKKDGNIVLAYSTSTLVDDKGDILYSPRSFSEQIFTSEQYLRKYLVLYNFVQNASSAIFRRDVALSIDKSYTELKGAGDYLFWVEISLKGHVAVVNKGLNKFRRHVGVVTEKKEADGTNFIEEKLIFNYISSKVKLSWFRILYAHIYRMNIIKHVNFIDKSTKDYIYKIWEVDKYDTKINRQILRIANYLRSFNFFI